MWLHPSVMQEESKSGLKGTKSTEVLDVVQDAETFWNRAKLLNFSKTFDDACSFCLYCFWSQGLALYPSLASNSWSSYLSLFSGKNPGRGCCTCIWDLMWSLHHMQTYLVSASIIKKDIQSPCTESILCIWKWELHNNIFLRFKIMQSSVGISK